MSGVTDTGARSGSGQSRNAERADGVTDAGSSPAASQSRNERGENWWDIEDLEERQRAWEEQDIRPWHIEDPEERERVYRANWERVAYVRAKHARIVAEGKYCSKCGAEIGDTVYRYKPLLEPGGSYTSSAYRSNPTVNADPICETCAPDWLPGLETRVYKVYMYSHRVPCASCGRGVVFVSAYKTPPVNRVFCSEDCKHKKKGRTNPSEKYKHCEACGESFTVTRSDAKYCKVACKQKAYRARKKA